MTNGSGVSRGGTQPKGSRRTAIATLLLLSPLIGEVMSGATRFSYLFVLVPEIMVWGCGTLLIREAVRRWRAGATSTLLLGFGLAIAEEFLIQQTSVAPLPFLASPGYGRAFGVNWPYFAFMLAYEAVWVVLVPIQVTELLLPGRRDEPWLRARGIVASCLTFAGGSFIAWFLWTQNARPNVFHVPVYNPPVATLAAGALAIVVLAVAAFAARRVGLASPDRRVPRPWVPAVIALVFGFPWYGLMAVVFAPNVTIALWVPLLVAALWGAAAYALVRRVSSGSGWGDRHRWALSSGAILVCMIAGFLGSSYWSRLDVVAKIVMNVAAVAGLIALRVRIASRTAA